MRLGAYVGRVEIFCKGEEIVRHGRIWEKEQVRFEPVHYLPLLERKPGALAPDYLPPGVPLSPLRNTG